MTVRTRHPSVLVAVLAAAGISVSLTQTLIVPIIPELPAMLGADSANASWAVTATLLAAAVATPLYGRFGDLYGPRRMLIICALALAAGSLICALSDSLAPFVAGRALQGLGMPIVPLGISVLRSSVPPDRVGSAMGVMSSSLGVGGAMGLPLSAIIVQHTHWHALFWLATGLGALATVLFATLVPPVPAVSTGRFDPLGTVLLTAGLLALLLPISKGASWGWGSPLTVGMFVASAVIFAVFALWQLKIPSPIVDLRTTFRRPVLLTNLASVSMGFAWFTLMLVSPQVLELPTSLEHGLGQSLIATGLWMAPGGLAMMVFSSVSAAVAKRRGPKFTLVLGCAIIAASFLAGPWLLGSAPLVMLLGIIVSVGVGFGFAALPALINAAVPITETAAANGINALARSLGTSISSTVMTAILTAMVVWAPATADAPAHPVPSAAGFTAALLVAGAVALVATVLAMLIPDPIAALRDEPA
ncbi:MFS transporter [Mycolicibacterium brumae]|uniref:MFS transporter n=1 Tax=Mycolicibacterium brumae TaxID=85968 RepID=UPI000AE0CCBF|nr:MFS transporter [Mycolicibacterium brumae]MCV7193954.1 MFS transporter [Mycolicibacterium brumae]UWW08002.1 MFS transporter [Mycolicibacterium brumae]